MKTETKQTPDACEKALNANIQGTRHARKFIAQLVAALIKVRSSNLVKIANAQNADENMVDENMVEVVTDHKNDRYILLNIAWKKYDRTYYNVVNLDIIDGKIWIQEDNTEEGIAADLEKYRVPKDKIVLAFKSPALRKYTEYAPA